MGLLSREALVVIVLAAFPHTGQAELLSSYIHAIFRMSTVTEAAINLRRTVGFGKGPEGRLVGRSFVELVKRIRWRLGALEVLLKLNALRA